MGRNGVSESSQPWDEVEADLDGKPAPEYLAALKAELRRELQVGQIELATQNKTLRQALLELEESRDRYRGLYELSPLAYLTLDRDGLIEAINLTGAALFGYDRKQLLGRRFEQLIAPESQAQWGRHVIRSWQTRGKTDCELTLERQGGSTLFARLDCLPVTDGDAAPTLRLAVTDISARRQAEIASQESEARFRAMANAAPVLLWVAGADKRYSWVNQQWLDFTGRSMAQELGDGWTEMIHPDDSLRCLEICRDAFDRREPFAVEYRLRRADGRYRWLLDRGQPHYDSNKLFIGYVGSCTDVTERKLREDDLHRAQGVGHIGSWRLDVVNNRLNWSPENYRIFGVAEGSPLNYQTFLKRVHPDDVAYVDRCWQAALGGQPYDIEHRLLIDGQLKWVREKAELEFDEQGVLLGGFGITQDISEIKRARQDLAASEERFRNFMTHGPLASWIVDPDGRFQYVSPTYTKIFGVPVSNLVGKLISEVYPPELANRYARSNQEAIDAGQPTEGIYPGLRNDGSAGEFLVVKFPVRDPDGAPLLCAMALDVTERRKTLAELQAANQRLEELAAEQSAHLARLADELTNAEQRERDRLYEYLHDDVQPLLVAARLALSSLSPRTALQDALRTAADATEHISQVIQLARTLSRELNPPLIRDRGLIPAVESLCGWVRRNHGLEVELQGESDIAPEDVTTRLLCFRAIRELLLNVVKHAATSRATLTLAQVDGDVLQITVADDGKGIDPPASSGGRGTGLLEIERRLQMLRGSMLVDSAPGGGTRVTIRLPKRDVTAVAPPAGNLAPQGHWGEQDQDA